MALSPAAVESDDLSGEIGIFIAQVIYQISHFLGPPQASGWDLAAAAAGV